MKQPIELTLDTADGTRFALNVWVQAGHVRIEVKGFLTFVLIFKPQSMRAACEKILKLLNSN